MRRGGVDFSGRGSRYVSRTLLIRGARLYVSSSTETVNLRMNPRYQGSCRTAATNRLASASVSVMAVPTTTA